MKKGGATQKGKTYPRKENLSVIIYIYISYYILYFFDFDDPQKKNLTITNNL